MLNEMLWSKGILEEVVEGTMLRQKGRLQAIELDALRRIYRSSELESVPTIATRK